MMYECKLCEYKSSRKQNLERHKNRKIKCSNVDNGVYQIKKDLNGVNDVEENITQNEENEENITQNEENEENITQNEENITQNEENITQNEENITCYKCQKVLCNSSSLKHHIQICKGVDSLTCPTCFEKFKNAVTKFRHEKKKVCTIPSIKDKEVYNQEVNITCYKCKKVLCNSSSLKHHMQICKGVDSLTCPICFEKFENAVTKFRHEKKKVCTIPTIKDKEVYNQEVNTINNIENQTIINNTTNNMIKNNNIQINVFGNEDLTYLLQDNDIINKIKSFGKSGVYGFPKILDDIHFNMNKPENNTIIKPDEYGDGVMIKNDDNEWEFREFEDIRDDLIATIVKYFKAYNTVKKNLGIQLIERKERNIIKNFGYELMLLDGTIPSDLYEELEMDEDDVEENEEDVKNKTRKFDKSTMKNLYKKTSMYYKKENGGYIKNRCS
jgi:hypothetical protein